MTAATLDRAPRGAASTTRRTLNVVHLQFINTQTFIWVPLIIVGATLMITFAVFWIISDLGGAEGVLVGGGTQAPMWYFLVVGAQAMTLSFPFSQAMSTTRREFFTGSVLAAAISALGLALVYVVLGLIERATDGFGRGWFFANLEWLWAQGVGVAGLTYFTATLFFFISGFWFATIYRRGSARALSITITAVLLVLLGALALITWQGAWPDVIGFFLDVGPIMIAAIFVALSVVMGVVSYLTLRKLPA